MTCTNLYAKGTSNETMSLEIGKAIYQKGLLPNGERITALGKDGLPHIIGKTACMDCHRRSGLGSSESGLLVAPITGDYLLKNNKPKGSKLIDIVGQAKPRYTESTLYAAIQKGVRPDGEQLNEIMPRYNLSIDNLNHLIAYLKYLNKSKVPGLTDTQIDLAVVMTPDISPQNKTTMLEIMEKYLTRINKDIRQLSISKSPIHGRHKPFRKWKLHIWELKGESDTWEQQLEQKYKDSPVFAFIGGYGDWRIIHDFCEKNEIPSLFPTTNLANVSKNDFYTLYFSEGINLDVNVLSTHIINQNKKMPVGKILQIHNETELGKSAAKLFEEKLSSNKMSNITTISLAKIIDSKLPIADFIKEQNPEKLVLWLDKNQSIALINEDKTALPKDVYISSRAMAVLDVSELTGKIPESSKDIITLIHPFYLKEANKNHLVRTNIWMRTNKIKYENERITANTYFSLAVLSGAIKSSSFNLNREFLIEQYEHMIDNTVYRSIYPHLSLGPDQRYASKGAYLVKLSQKTKPEWVIPNF